MSTAAKNSLEKVAEEFYKEVTAELEEGRAQALGSLEGVGRETTEAVAKIVEAGNKQAESLMRQITGSAELRSRNLQLRATPVKSKVGEGDYPTSEPENGKVVMSPDESIAKSPTSTITGLAVGIPIKEPVDEEIQKSAAGRIRKKRERK